MLSIRFSAEFWCRKTFFCLDGRVLDATGDWWLLSRTVFPRFLGSLGVQSIIFIISGCSKSGWQYFFLIPGCSGPQSNTSIIAGCSETREHLATISGCSGSPGDYFMISGCCASPEHYLHHSWMLWKSRALLLLFLDALGVYSE